MFSSKYLIRLVDTLFFRPRDNILNNTDLYWIILINSYFNNLTSNYRDIKIWRRNEQAWIILTLSNALSLILYTLVVLKNVYNVIFRRGVIISDFV